MLHDFRHGTAGHIGAWGFSESGLPIGVQIVGKLGILSCYASRVLLRPRLVRAVRTWTSFANQPCVEMTQKTLTIMAHPDDAEFSAGGLMTLCTRRATESKSLPDNGNAGHHTLSETSLLPEDLGSAAGSGLSWCRIRDLAGRRWSPYTIN